MRKLFCIILLFAFATGLCGCSETEPETSTAAPTTHTEPVTSSALPTTYTEPVTSSAYQTTQSEPAAETHSETTSETALSSETSTETLPTEPPTPTHSELYLPEYTSEQIWLYFSEVVLDSEYTDGTGDVTLVQKWLYPLRYKIYGTPTDEDCAVLTEFFAQLNAIPGFPGIYAAEDGEFENLSLCFLQPEDFRTQFSDVIHGEEASGATQFWYYTATNEIYTAQIGYRTDIDQSARNSILIEEIVNTLGITDTVLREDSIVYQYSDENTVLSDVDRIILQILYDPAIQCGMDTEACAAVVQDLYY